MVESPRYSQSEAYTWLQLTRQIDMDYFERTGQVVVSELSMESIAAESEADGEGKMTTATVQHALQLLAEKGHLRLDLDTAGLPQACRLFLHHASDPDL